MIILTNIHVRIYVFDKIYIGPLDGIRVFIFKKNRIQITLYIRMSEKSSNNIISLMR